MREYIIAGLGVLGTAIGSFLSYFLTRKKFEAQVDENIITNMQKALDFYEKLAESTNNKLNDLLEKIKVLEKENEEFKEQKKKQDEKIEVLEKQVKELFEISCTIKSCNKRKKAKTETKDK